MPRKYRIVIAGKPHHVTQRGNRRQPVFFSSYDKGIYLKLLKEATVKNQVKIWAYCLMDNHVHLILVPEVEASLAKAVAEVNRRFTCIINKRNKWRGYLWQGRFLSSVMDDCYLIRAMHYVENNPVRAGIVKRAWEYPWSSASTHVFGSQDSILDVFPYERLIGDWRQFLMQTELEGILLDIRQRSRGCLPLGENEFIQKLSIDLGIDFALLNPRPNGRPKKN
ncbi:MAG: transposase [Candidatus Omnitrophota bacterium]